MQFLVNDALKLWIFIIIIKKPLINREPVEFWQQGNDAPMLLDVQ